MPVSKPQSLNRSHQTKAEKKTRESHESTMTPVTQLSLTPPALLQKHKHAIGTWERLIGLYDEVEGTIVTAFDADLLAKYCILEEECLWLEGKRLEVDRNAVRLDKQLAAIKPKGDELKTYYNLLELYNALNARVQGLDARLDGKRKLLHSIAQSLYLTPRSRAGAAPRTKPTRETDDFGTEYD